MFAHQFLDYSAQRYPDKIAVTTKDNSISYHQLFLNSTSFADWLQHMGVREGDRIVLVLPNSIPLITAVMAASRIGAVL